MAIERLKSQYYIPPQFENFGTQLSQASYALGRNYEFVSIGQIGTTAGVRYQAHYYTPGSSGSLTFSSGGYIDMLLVAAGGSGGLGYWDANVAANRNIAGGGGGAGGLVVRYNEIVVANTAYSFTVAATPSFGAGSIGSGANSTFLGYTAVGGGYGGYYGPTNPATGGSGGGGAYNYQNGNINGAAGTSGQGNAGGNSTAGGSSGGGGGYLTAGSIGGVNPSGGSGISFTFDGILRSFCAGGAAGARLGGLVDGIETGGEGGYTSTLAPWQTFNGTTPIAIGCGGGGGYASSPGIPAASGSGAGNGSGGVLIIRYAVS